MILTGAGPGFSLNVSSSSLFVFSELQPTSSSVDWETSEMWEITLFPSTDSVRREPERLLWASHEIVCRKGLKKLKHHHCYFRNRKKVFFEFMVLINNKKIINSVILEFRHTCDSFSQEPNTASPWVPLIGTLKRP